MFSQKTEEREGFFQTAFKIKDESLILDKVKAQIKVVLLIVFISFGIIYLLKVNQIFLDRR